MGRCVRAGNAALNLWVFNALGQGRKRLGRLIARLHLHGGPIDCAAIEPWRRPGLEPPKRKSKALQRQREADRRRFADASRRRRSLANVDETPQKGPGCQYDGPCPDLAAIFELKASASLVADDEVVGLRFDHREIRYRGNRLLHGPGIEPAIGLGARSPYCRSFASIENSELDAAEVRHSPHQTVQRVNLADEMPLPQAADRGIAGHCADSGEAMGNQGGLGAHARSRRGRLTAGMAAAHHDHIVLPIHCLQTFGRAST